jgi:non-specific serine/threonine protein kinase
MGEFVHRVASLSIPANLPSLDANAASKHSAIELFTRRAAAAQQGFMLTNSTAPIVAEICRRLDGIPLGIELAAARVNHFAIEVLGEKIERQFEILSTGDHHVLPRQRTMRAVFDWSYDHLSASEQRLLRRLATFVGGFTLELAIGICANVLTESEVLDLLASLIDKSLIQTEFHPNGVRYRLLEATRQYAGERTEDLGESADLAQAHGMTIYELVRQLEAALWNGMPRLKWLPRVGSELGNLQAALTWAFYGNGDVVAGQGIVGALEPFWVASAEVEGRRWLTTALESVTQETPGAIRASLELIACNFGTMGGEPILALAESALGYYRSVGDARNAARAQCFAGDDLLRSGRIIEGESSSRQALEAARALGMPPLTIIALQCLAKARLLQGDTAGAKELLYEAQATCQKDSPDIAVMISLTIAEVEFQEGSVHAALDRTQSAAEIFRAGKISTPLVYALNNISAYLISLARFDEARASALEALALNRGLGNASQTLDAVQHLAAIGALRHQDSAAPHVNYLQRISRLLGFVDAGVNERGYTRDYVDQQEYEKIAKVLATSLGSEQFDKLVAEGRTWREISAVTEAADI